MDAGYLLFLCLVIGIPSIILILVLKKNMKREAYEFVLVFMRPGVNDHVLIRGSKLDFIFEHDKKKYQIKSDRLYRVKPPRPLRLWWRFIGVKERFLSVYPHGEKEPIGPTQVKVTTRILKQVNDSRALNKAMSSEFKVPWDLKKILMIVGFVVIVAVVYVLVMGGELSL